MQRGNERFLSSEDFTITREGNQLVSTANIQVETGSNAPLTAITSLTYDNGESGDIFINTIPVRSNLGSPPVIDSVSFPAEIIKPATGSTPVLFIAYVSDPDGPENIDIVTMSIFDAEQNPVGAPLRLYDDGGQTDLGNGVRSGDTTANDRAFSRTLQIDNSNTARTLTLRFQATDKSGQLSNVIEQPFTISEP